jgi:hypothetical protein
MVPLRERRRATVLVLLATAIGERDVTYVRELAAAEPALTGWDGRVLLVVPEVGDASRALADAAPPFPVVVDERHVVAEAAQVTAPAVVVSDQWGEVHAATPAGADAATGTDAPWLAVGEVERWVQWLAIRCAG